MFFWNNDRGNSILLKEQLKTEGSSHATYKYYSYNMYAQIHCCSIQLFTKTNHSKEGKQVFIFFFNKHDDIHFDTIVVFIHSHFSVKLRFTYKDILFNLL